MRLPIIKHVLSFIEENDIDFVHETLELLEHMTDSKYVKEQEIDVIGELMSNMYGAIEVQKSIKGGATKKDALNGFMKRVMGSID